MVKKRILIINGPNLNLVGTRQTAIYGDKSFDEFLNELKQSNTEFKLDYFQSNIEGEIINEIQNSDAVYKGIVLNAGGYTHTSVAIADAIAAISLPVVEVHISKPKTREMERHFSLIEEACVGTISGFGLSSYALALNYFKNSPL